ncbi:hypothetical protein CEXT_646351 [Caerostris extrusa]|uniref:Uncharacterized protein n=1 Tax=Caerostris extrusa TaxID=172846 RepID=A0AAV4M8L9_CAEEX|nr:hypothetical protein CEXT_646351 [Caerostris extrusa]
MSWAKRLRPTSSFCTPSSSNHAGKPCQGKRKKNDVRKELLHCPSVATRIIDHVRYAARKDSFVEDAYLLILFCSREKELGMLMSEDRLE